MCARLDDASGDGLLLDRRSYGYVLEADRHQVDLHHFHHLVGRAHDVRVPDTERVSLLGEALGLWRGEPLSGLDGPWVEQMRRAWRRERVDATIEWARIQARLGASAATIGPLSALLDDFPLVEPLAEELMRALHATGRDAEALLCFASPTTTSANTARPPPAMKEPWRSSTTSEAATTRRTSSPTSATPTTRPGTPKPPAKPGPCPWRSSRNSITRMPRHCEPGSTIISTWIRQTRCCPHAADCSSPISTPAVVHHPRQSWALVRAQRADGVSDLHKGDRIARGDIPANRGSRQTPSGWTLTLQGERCSHSRPGVCAAPRVGSSAGSSCVRPN
ncbi:bacterial transcriptional activator domain-containing protein [Streptomyces sp. MBT62]|nr:bacterial transcriptional activator domain-containing protein [Streptomyces sp. MBT62]